MAVFFGWRVVAAAFVVALFGWGFGFYGPPVFLHALEGRMPRWLVSLAVTCHFLAGAIVVARMPALQARFGIARVVTAGAVATALGVLGWALAAAPWQLFAATLLSGAGWACTGGAAINAIVAPWFARKRPMALGMAFNGASMGGVVLGPLWVALIAWLGFPAAAALLGSAMVLALAAIGARYLGRTPAQMGLAPDGEAPRAAPPRPPAALGPPWRDRRFATLAGANALCLFAQLGLVAHLVSVLAPALGGQGAGLAMGLATGCAVAGRVLAGWLLRPGLSRRRVFAGNAAMQAAGVALLAVSSDPALLLAAVAVFGFGIGNATTLPPLIAQQDFPEADVGRVVALLVATGQATYAFAPAAFGLLREVGEAPFFAGLVACQLAAAAVALARVRT
ncbi:MFS transporter [Falsiroseomonas sp. HW251]|uniref:MFS transporter n=1 Tax=Falsiroseomonas sp. HW251 TaxID=3390998 RepID=UPI003D321F58